MNKEIVRMDRSIIAWLRMYHEPIARGALFVVYFWFGLLKVVSTSAANPLVTALLLRTMPGVPFTTFNILFGLFEMVLGVLFLIPRAERLAIALLIPHLLSTALALVLVPDFTWQAPLVPTIEGQYIIKNLIIIALAFSIAARLTPFKK